MWQYIQTTVDTQLDKMMYTVYHRLNRKLNAIQKQETHNKTDSTTMKRTFHTHLVNLTQTKFSKDQINTLQLGFDYTLEKNPKQYINTLIVETENAIRHLNIQIQNTFQHLAYRKLKQITETDTHNTLHKRHRYNLKQIKLTLEGNDLTIAKADKAERRS